MIVRDMLKRISFLRNGYDVLRRYMKKATRQAQKVDYVCTDDGISFIKNRISGAAAF